MSTQEIEKIFNSVNAKNSYGYDVISRKLLKISSPYISSPLNYICNKVLATGFFPSHLKYSEIKPLHKKGDKSNIANYRPISLLPSFSKVFEKVIYIRLLEHIYNNNNNNNNNNDDDDDDDDDDSNILVKEQFGFRSKSSTEMTFYNLISEILDALNNKNVIGVFFVTSLRLSTLLLTRSCCQN
jgi:hypothetical protein